MTDTVAPAQQPSGAGGVPVTLTGSPSTPTIEVVPEPTLFVPKPVYPPLVDGLIADVYGNAAYFNHLNVVAPIGGGGPGGVNSSLIPNPGHTFDLGSASNPWRNIYVDNIIPNPNLAGGANLLTNGGFEVWQRGNGPFSASGVLTADRWRMNLAGTDTLTINRANAPVGSYGQYALSANFTLGTSGATPTQIFQGLSRSDGYALQGKTVSYSIYVSTGIPNAVRAYLASDGTGGVVQQSAFNSGAPNNAQVLTVTYPVPADATFLNVGLFFYATSAPAIDNAMLVIGPTPVDFVPMNPADDFFRCLRYYEIIGTPGVAPTELGVGRAFSTTQALIFFRYQQKAVSPTLVTVGSPQLTSATGGTIALSNSAATNVGINSGGIVYTTAGAALNPGDATGLVATAVGQYVYAEANA